MIQHDMNDKTCVITGANTGIGKESAIALAASGARMILAGRSLERTKPVLNKINDDAGEERATFLELDLASLQSVRTAAAGILDRTDSIDILINNAGVGGARGLSEDGFEIHFAINHLGHFLLTNLLLERIRESAPARIVTVASRAHKRTDGICFDVLQSPTKSVTGMPEYSASKLANVLFSWELSKRLEGTDVSTYSVHPGVVATDLWRTVPALFRPLIKLFMISSTDGARSTIHCATSADAADKTGLYWDEKGHPKKPTRPARDPDLAAELWRLSEEWTELVDHDESSSISTA